jgi:mannose-6-phosphate isomerase-like protein (cupin superfamily)
MSAALGEVTVVGGQDGPELDIVDGEGTARAVIWPGMGARLRSLHRISLGAGSRTVELSHPTDAVYYVIDGDGEVRDGGPGTAEPLVAGSMIHVDHGTAYTLVAGRDGMEVVGGPAPADPALYPAEAG